MENGTADTSLTAIVDKALVENLPPKLKRMIDLVLSKGATKTEVLSYIKEELGHRGLTLLAVEAYLGADQQGQMRKERR